jgi:hypothetical protein
MPIAAILFALVSVVTLVSAVGQAHELPAPRGLPRAATEHVGDADDGDTDVASLTRALLDDQLRVEDRRRIAAVRQQRLGELMARHPAAVLRHALSSAERAALPTELQAFAEEEQSHEGTIEVLHADEPDGRGSYHYGLRTDAGHWLTLRFALGGPQVLTGSVVRVRGVRVEGPLRSAAARRSPCSRRRHCLARSASARCWSSCSRS